VAAIEDFCANRAEEVKSQIQMEEVIGRISVIALKASTRGINREQCEKMAQRMNKMFKEDEMMEPENQEHDILQMLLANCECL